MFAFIREILDAAKCSFIESDIREMATGTTPNFGNQKWGMRWEYSQENGLLSIDQSFGGVNWEDEGNQIRLEGADQLEDYRLNQINKSISGESAIGILKQ